jgi:hypothetical protein
MYSRIFNDRRRQIAIVIRVKLICQFFSPPDLLVEVGTDFLWEAVHGVDLI